MPLIRPNDPPFLGLPTRFASVLPPSGVVNGQVSPLFASLRDADLGALMIENQCSMAAQFGRELAGGVGWPEAELDNLAALVSTAFERIPADEVAKIIASAAMQIPEALGEVQKAVTETISGVPLLGWVVKLGMLVWQIVDAARARAPDIASAAALGYEREDDEFATDGLVTRTGSRDWTAMFLPPEGPFSVLDLAYTSSGIADGLAWGQIAAVSDRLGLVPGVGQICGYWQSPRKLYGSSRDAGIESIVLGRELYPSATSFAALIWSNAQLAGSPTLGQIDLDRVAEAWAAYGDTLEAFANNQGTWVAAQIRNGWRWYNEEKTVAGPAENRGKYEGLYGPDKDSAPEKFRGWGLQNLIAWRVDRARDRVRKGLSTLSVAYMGPDSPALRDNALRELWAKNRAILLTHKARALVDLELVPDADYRSAIAAAQKSAATDLKAPTTPPPPPKPGPFGGVAVMPATLYIPTIDDSPPPPRPEPPTLPGMPDDPQSPSGAGVSGGLVIATLFALLALARRRG